MNSPQEKSNNFDFKDLSQEAHEISSELGGSTDRLVDKLDIGVERYNKHKKEQDEISRKSIIFLKEKLERGTPEMKEEVDRYLSESEVVKTRQLETPMKTECRVSVTIPALNEEENIEQTLKSFKCQTDSSGEGIDPDIFEVIVVDNGSTDETIKKVREFAAKNPELNIHVITEEKKGAGSSRKRGMDEALVRGIEREQGGMDDLILAGTDADTLVNEHWIADIMEKLEDSDIDCLAGLITSKSGIVEILKEKASESDDLGEEFEFTVKLREIIKEMEKNIEVLGANFTIRGSVYGLIGGVKQKYNSEGNPLAGEDSQIDGDVKELGGKVDVLTTENATSVRRGLKALLDGKMHENPYEGGHRIIEETDDKLTEEALKMPKESWIEIMAVSNRNKLSKILTESVNGVENYENLDEQVQVMIDKREFEFIKGEIEFLNRNQRREKGNEIADKLIDQIRRRVLSKK